MLLFRKKKHRLVYTITAGILFSLVAILHLVRAINKWDLMIGTFMVPVWVSWVVFIVLGYLAYRGFTRKV